MGDLATGAAGIGALADPTRRALYDYVSAQEDAVGREVVADALGLPVHTVRFHLDRLEDEGMLDSEFRRLTGRTGPGAGRPAKLYRRSARELSVSLPPRQYDLAGRILADAMARARGGEDADQALSEATREAARRVVAESSAPSTGAEARATAFEDVLVACGYEPRARADGIRLTNCPFHALAQEQTDLVCGMNVTFVQTLSDALDSGTVAELTPTPGECCVTCRGPRAQSRDSSPRAT